MKKNAFSYIELIFAMILIIVLMAMSGPLISKRIKKPSANVYGVYKCWMTHNGSKNVFYEQTGYNTDALSEIKEVSSCVFNKPTGATNFKVTLVGGGSGGGSAILPTKGKRYAIKTLEVSDGTMDLTKLKNKLTSTEWNKVSNSFTQSGDQITYTSPNGGTKFDIKGVKVIKKIDAINIVPGQGGNAGEVLILSLPLASMPFNNNKITITTTSATNITGITPSNGYIYIGTTINNKDTGRVSCLRVANSNSLSLPVNCVSAGTNVAKCCASGGAKINTNSNNYEVVEAQPNQTYTYVSGKNGTYNATVQMENFQQGLGSNGSGCTTKPTTACLTPAPATIMGSGGGGAGYATNNTNNTNYKFQQYTIVKALNNNEEALSDIHDTYVTGSKNATEPEYQDVSSIYTGTGGRGGGGGVIIEW